MLKGLVKWILFALSLMLIAKIIPGIDVAGFTAALAAVFIIGFINLFIKPIVVLLTLPVTIVTLGLFALIINAALFALAAFVVPGFAIGGFIPALVGSVLFSIVSVFLNKI